MSLSHALLIEKSFELNTYDSGKYYEYTTKDDEMLSKILKGDYDEMTETVIIQMKEDYSNKVICVDNNVWDLRDDELEKILESM